MFEAVFSGARKPTEAIIAFLKEIPFDQTSAADYPDEMIPRLAWKSPFPLLRHHFGIPAENIAPTIAGIQEIAEAHVLDVISLGADQDAQENLFRS